VVWLEAGAFGFAADWGATQQALTAAGWRSCAYDRAGMGFSPPGPAPRDGLAIVSDFEKLVAASGEKGPFILVGHSMAGLRLREYAGRNPDKVAGLVLVDAATADAAMPKRFHAVRQGLQRRPRDGRRGGRRSGCSSRWPIPRLGDKIGLPPAAKAEKRWAFANGRHNRTVAQEVALWPQAARQAPPCRPTIPPGRWRWSRPGRSRAARPGRPCSRPRRTASRHGYVDHVEAATHTRLLGEAFAGHIVKAVAFVAGARKEVKPPPTGEVSASADGGGSDRQSASTRIEIPKTPPTGLRPPPPQGEVYRQNKARVDRSTRACCVQKAGSVA
jgi:pimeloyl-ACP methyl ester carboxylesterase